MTTGSSTSTTLDVARQAYRQRDWLSARDGFERALEQAPELLGPDDRYALANCSWWVADLDRAIPLMEDAYRCYLDDDRPSGAALVAIDIGYTLVLRGDDARSSGWIARATRLLEQQPDCVERGYLDHLAFEDAFHAGDLDGAYEAAQRVLEHGRRFDDATLCALGVTGEGRVLLRRGEVAAGMARFDEAMLAAVSDDVEPGWAGNIYCHLMIACYEIADLRRASEWTDATARWCESMPGAGPFQGICRIHRAQILQIRGAWRDAEREASHVCEMLTAFDASIVAEAHYLLGDLRRQRGDLDGAEASYREAHRHGRDPQPGLALCRAVRGELAAASASIHSALTAARDDPIARSHLLPAAIEVALAGGDVERASAWADELANVAQVYGTTGLEAPALLARGAVLLARGEAAGAIPALRDAVRTTQALDAPYDTARARLLLARAYDHLGDEAAATLERQAAEGMFAELGVAVPAPMVEPTRTAAHPAGLTPREVEVLGLVATGRSNQQIADELVLSVRTVERHLATIYQKLGLEGRSARAGAVSLALREGLLGSS